MLSLHPAHRSMTMVPGGELALCHGGHGTIVITASRATPGLDRLRWRYSAMPSGQPAPLLASTS